MSFYTPTGRETSARFISCLIDNGLLHTSIRP